MNLLKRIAVKISLKFATHLLPVSEYLYKSIAILSPSSLKKSKVVANCVDLENIYSFNYRPSRDVFTIVTVCSYDERSIDVKNLHTLMHASFALAQKDLHVHLTIIGRDGPCFAMIEQYMNSHLPKQRFTLYKDLYIHQVFDVLSTCSLFVQISAVETFGLAAMEAACLGVPLLLSNEGALPEIFRNRAYFVSSDISSDSLASYLYDLIRQPTINNLNDLIYFRKNYSLEQRMLSLQSVINNVLAT